MTRLWRAFVAGFRTLALRSRADRDLDDELQHYLDQATDAYRQSGLAPEQAARAARAEIGSTAAVKEHVRSSTWEAMLESIWRDVLYGVRVLRRAPSFAVMAVTVLALSLGANTAVFSIVNAILLRPLPVRAPSELAFVYGPNRGFGPVGTYEDMRSLRSENDVFSDVAATNTERALIGTGSDTIEVAGEAVSANYFDLLGVEFKREPLVVLNSRRVRLPLDDEGKIAPGRLAAALMAMAGLVLLIGVANLAGLTIARGIVRKPEISVRLTLGASRGRLARQLVIEGLLLAAMGGLGGLVGSRWLIELFLASLPTSFGATFGLESLDVPIDLHVLSFTVLLIAVVGFIVGLAPVRQASKTDLLSTIGGVSEAAPRHVRSGLRHWIVIPQVCLCTVLLLSAGIAVTTLLKVALVDPGYQPERAAFVKFGLWRISPGYFAAIGLHIRQGRVFEARDSEDAAHVAIVDQNLADRLWPGATPVGQYLGIHQAASSRVPDWIQIVGVVDDVRLPLSEGESNPHVYLPMAQNTAQRNYSSIALVARGRMTDADLLKTLRAAVWKADAETVIGSSQTLTEAIETIRYPRRIAAALLASSGLVGLLLASVGLYGVVSYSVAQQMRELGIRAALGADRSDITRFVLREGITVAVIGSALGFAAAFAGIRVVSHQVFAIPAMDSATIVTVPTILAAVVVLACYLPARRASVADPMVVLRWL